MRNILESFSGLEKATFKERPKLWFAKNRTCSVKIDQDDREVWRGGLEGWFMDQLMKVRMFRIITLWMALVLSWRLPPERSFAEQPTYFFGLASINHI